MTKAVFWKLIESTKRADPEEHAKQLVTTLTKLELNEIIAFGKLWDVFHTEACTANLCGAAEVIFGKWAETGDWLGCSDDGFFDFRSWLILKGEKPYLAALLDPDSLVNIELGSEEFPASECYPAEMAYYGATGDFIPDEIREEMKKNQYATWGRLKGEDWVFVDDDTELARRYPKLYAKYENKYHSE
jgi:Protein of unknown function (DUF4240)